ncbi:MAG: TonB-dependent receptor [Phenylobacterium sp.]|nr:TonB-dependent receptor [Phenylobacterium sp.]
MRSMRQRLLASSMICGAAFLGLANSAAAQADDKDDAVAEVVVTGTRIPTPNLTSVSPVTAIGAAEIKAAGITRVEDIINTLPQAFASQGSNVSNGSNGTATVNLRGLGASRTLVLINGRRMGAGNPTSINNPVADLNFIPSSLVERVDVLTGGASAVYGADAVAGVVNFIMTQNFEGVRVDANYSIYQHHNDSFVQDALRLKAAAAGANAPQFAIPKSNVRDGEASEVTLTFGVNAADGKGNITAFASFIQQNAVLQGARDYSACTLNSGADFTSLAACGGSGTATPARVGNFTVQGNTFRVRNATTDVYNFGPSNYYIRPDERYRLGAFAHYEIAPWAEAYAEMMFMDDRSVAQIAPGGIFAGTFSVNCDNAFMTAAQQTQLCGANAGTAALFTGTVAKRNVEGGGRQSEFRHNTYRYVIGLRGDLNDSWNYDSYMEYAATKFDARQTAYFLKSRIDNALIAKRNAAGQIVCGVNQVTVTDAACVPYNIFSEGAVTQAMLDYLQVPASTFGNTAERVVNFSLGGDLSAYGVKSPWARDGVGVAFGAEYRREHIDFDGDFVSRTPGQLNGGGAASTPINASFDVYEVYGEARIPIVQDAPLAKSLSLELGYRYSDYSYDVTTDTYKIAGEYEPIDGLRFRASYQRAVRAPNLVELFGPQIHALDGSTDPCAALPDTAANAALIARCGAVHGYTKAQVLSIEANVANQYYGLLGGNPNLDPEKSDTYSVGFVYQPDFVPGATLTVDYFNIKVNDYISNIGADTILAKCYLQNDDSYCPLIVRDARTRSLYLNSSGPDGHVVDLTQNTGSLKTSGLDFSAAYRTDLDRFGMSNAGGVNVSFVGTYLNELSSAILPGDPFVDCAGYYGSLCNGRPGSTIPNPKWRHKARLTWNTPFEYGDWVKSWSVSLQWRHFSSVKLDALSSDPALNAANPPASDLKLATRDYFDLLTSFTVRDNLNFRAGINNLFDKDPPLVGQTNCIPNASCSGNAYSQVYDVLGRYLFIGLTADF